MRATIGRGWGADPPAVAYVYAPDCKESQPIAHLAGFTGVLQVDGYAGYRALAETPGLSRASCWSHVRRRFFEPSWPSRRRSRPRRSSASLCCTPSKGDSR
jgi:hypothetical protein